MALKPQIQKNWIKGLVSVSNRFSLPKGALPVLVNLLLGERGAVQVCDGSARLSGISSPLGPILTLAPYTDITGLTTKVAAAFHDATHIDLYNYNADPATLLTNGGNLANTVNWNNPQILEFAGDLIVSLGNAAPPQVFTNASAVPVNLGATSAWQPDHLYNYGDMIVVGLAAFICYGMYNGVTEIASGTFGLGPIGPRGQPAGVSGSTIPPFNSGALGNYTFDGVLVWQFVGGATLALGQAPRGAAHLISHAGCLWAWNTAPVMSADGMDGPSVLRMSQINNPNSWPLINVVYVGKDDGTTGTGAAVFTIAESGIAPNASLILFKDFSGYQVTGLFQTSGFAIQQIKSDMGSVAARSTLFATGYGVLRLSHLGVALFDGVSDTVVSEEIRPFIFGLSSAGASGPGAGLDFSFAQNCRAALCTNPPMYLLAIPLTAGDSNYYGIAGGDGSLIRVLCYDLIFKAWAIIDPPFKISALNQIRIAGMEPLTTAGGFSDGVIRQMQSHDTIWDTGDKLKAMMESAIVGEPTARNYFHLINCRMHAPSKPVVTISPIFDSEAPPSTNPTIAAAGPSGSGVYGTNIQTVATYENESDFMTTTPTAQNASTARVQIAVTGKVTLESIEFQVSPKPPRAAGVAV